MANIKLNPVVERVHGKIGDLVFKKVFDSAYVSRTPSLSNREPSAAQRAIRDKFRLAARYGKAALADVPTRALYEAVAKQRKQPVFSLMIEDYFTPPSVDGIDLSAYSGQPGSTISVAASDDFDVVGVSVAISDDAGALLEQGAAIVSTTEPGRWTYTATTTVAAGTHVSVQATATDRPGNTGTKTENI